MGENETKDNVNSEVNNDDLKEEKTFTQAEVNQMMKKEKESGRRSILKELGIEDVKSTKEALAKYQEYLDSQKTDLEKAKEALLVAQSKTIAEESRANRAEFCLKAIAEFEANPKSVDDLIAIAMTKITDEKDVAAVITEMKNNEAYVGFFAKSVEVKNNIGTGGPMPKSKLNFGGSQDYGKRLAEQKLAKISKK